MPRTAPRAFGVDVALRERTFLLPQVPLIFQLDISPDGIPGGTVVIAPNPG